MPTPIVNARRQFLDGNGAPLSGGSVGMFVPGTLTDKRTTRDSAGAVANTNPVMLDSSGTASIFGTGRYRQIVKDCYGTLVWDWETSSIGGNANIPAIYVDDYGAISDGVTDSTAGLQAALNAAKPGQQVWLGQTGQYLIDSANLTVPKGIALCGSWQTPGSTNSSAVAGQAMDLTTLGGALVLNSSYTIIQLSGSSIAGVPVYRKGLTIPATDAAGFAGTALTVQGDDCYTGYCLLLGFALGYTSTNQVRAKLEWLYGDNVAGVKILNAFDTPYLDHLHMWPFCTYSSTSTDVAHRRNGIAFDIQGSALISMAHCFEHSYAIGYQLIADGGPVMVDCQAEADAAWVGAVGFQIGNGTGGNTSAKFIGCTAFTLTTGYAVNIPGGDFIEFHACSTTACTTSWNILSGDVRIIGGAMYLGNTGISVGTANCIISLDGLRGSNISGPIVDNVGGSNFIYVSPSCDFGRLTYGYTISTNMSTPVIGSNSQLAIPAFGDVFTIAGNADIFNILGGWAGRRITLIFNVSITLHTGSGIRLYGDADVVVHVGNTINLVHNGVGWFECGRSL